MLSVLEGFIPRRSCMRLSEFLLRVGLQGNIWNDSGAKITEKFIPIRNMSVHSSLDGMMTTYLWSDYGKLQPKILDIRPNRRCLHTSSYPVLDTADDRDCDLVQSPTHRPNSAVDSPTCRDRNPKGKTDHRQKKYLNSEHKKNKNRGMPQKRQGKNLIYEALVVTSPVPSTKREEGSTKTYSAIYSRKPQRQVSILF